MGNRSIYQDIPLHSVDEFLELAPAEMRPPEIMTNDHQLMIQRLSFELAERQR
jgi:THO complex subunit 5